MNDAAFGKLCTGFFHAQNLHVVDYGNAKGNEKTRKGMPDAYLRQEDGTYQFFQYTTTKTRTSLSTKLIKDIDECFLPSRDLPPPSERQIKRIVLCFNEAASILHQEKLRQHLATLDARIELELIGLDRIVKSMVLDSRYAPLVRNELGLSLDSGQLLTAQAFQSKYEATLDGIKLPLSYPLVAREAELEKGLQLLDRTDLLFLSGQAGVGKTRLGLAMGESFVAKHPEYQFRVIDFLEARSLIDDLRTYLPSSQAYVILVDDVNRLLPPMGDEAAFQTVFELLRPNRKNKVKLICTVREHTKAQVLSKLGMYPYEPIPISSVDSQGIRKFLEANFSLNEVAQDRILRLASGNFRLAVMAARKAKDTNDLNAIHTSADLFSAFFGEVALDRLFWQILGVVSLFQSVDGKDEDFWDRIRSAFDLHASVADIQGTLAILHQQELLKQQGQFLKVEDQVFASYVLFRSLVQEKSLTLYGYFATFFRSDREKLVKDALIPLINYFDREAVMEATRPAVERYWQDIQTQPEKALPFWQACWFFLPDTCLAYLYSLIQPLPVQEVKLPELDFERLARKENGYIPGQDATLNLILEFCRHPNSHFDFALQLLFLYLQRRPSNIEEASVFLRKEMAYGLEDITRLRYDKQSKFLAYFTDLLAESVISAHQLYVLLSVVPVWYKTRFEEVSSFDSNTINIREGKLPQSPELTTFRAQMWQALFQAFEHSPAEAMSSLQQYPPSEVESNRAIIAEDMSLLLPFVLEKLDPLDHGHALWIQNRLLGKVEFLTRKQEANEEAPKKDFELVETLLEQVREHFTNEAVQLYNLLHVSVSEERSWSKEDLRTSAPLKARISKFFAAHDLEGYRRFLTTFDQVSMHQKPYWAHHDAVSYVFEHLREKDPNLWLSVVEMALSRGNTVRLSSRFFVKEVLEATSGIEQAFAILNQPNDPFRLGQLFFLLYVAPSDLVPAWIVSEILNILRLERNSSIYIDLGQLAGYERTQVGFLQELLDILAAKRKAEPSFFFEIDWNKLVKEEATISQLDSVRLGQFYLETRIPQDCSSLDLTTYSDQAILSYFLKQDVHFIAKLIKACLEQCGLDAGRAFSHAPLDFIWELEQAEVIADSALRAFSPYFHLLFEHPAICLFKGAQNNPRTEAFLHQLLRAQAKDKGLVTMVFNVISHIFSEGQYLAFLQTWLGTNPTKTAEMLSDIKLTPDGIMVNDAEGKAYDQKISFLERVKGLLTGIEYLPHRQVLDKKIQSERASQRFHLERNFFDGIQEPPRRDQKEGFSPIIPPDLLRLYDQVLQKWPFAEIAIWTTRWLSGWMLHQPVNHWTVLEVDADMSEGVYEYLHSQKVFEGRIFVATYFTEIGLPVGKKGGILILPYEEETHSSNLWRKLRGVNTARLEKILVDLWADSTLFSAYQGKEWERIYQGATETHHIYLDFLIAYAKRRGLSQNFFQHIAHDTLPQP